MKYREENGLRIIEADSGKYIANKDKTNILGICVYMSKFAKQEDFVEITEEEKIAIEKTIEEKYKAEQSNIEGENAL